MVFSRPFGCGSPRCVLLRLIRLVATPPRCDLCVLLESAKQSLVVLVNCKVLIMVRDRKPCSRPQSGWERSRPLTLGKVNARAVASRELDSASLRILGSGQPAESGEARIGREASIRRTDRTPRGERRQRARKESPGTWEALRRAGASRPLWTGSHNGLGGGGAAADGFRGAGKSRSSRDGAKEPWPESSGVRGA